MDGEHRPPPGRGPGPERLAGRSLEIAFVIAAELSPEQRIELLDRWGRR